jgi:23S rRNA (guanosine2251-2'-O)-methyltransferase
MNNSNSDLLYGLHAVTSALRLHPEQIREIWVDKTRQDERIQLVLETARARNIMVHHVARNTLDRMLGNESHQGVLANSIASQLHSETELKILVETLDHSGFFLILDGIQDPHNLGACLRSADAAGVDAVIIPKDRAVSVTSTVRKVASGAADSVPIYRVTNLARCIKLLQDNGIWVMGLAEEAEKSIYEVDFTGSVALAMGAEGKGLRRLTKERCDELLNIPMAGHVESLNVSVAAGVCLLEVVRQRH